MNITIKSIPEDLGAALKRAAANSRRSLNGEIIHRLSMSLAENARVPQPAVAESPDAGRRGGCLGELGGPMEVGLERGGGDRRAL